MSRFSNPTGEGYGTQCSERKSIRMQQENQALLYAIYNKKATSTVVGSHIGSSPSSRWHRDRNADAGLVQEAANGERGGGMGQRERGGARHAPLAKALTGKVLPMPVKLLKKIFSGSESSRAMSTMDTQKSSLALTPVSFLSRPFSRYAVILFP